MKMLRKINKIFLIRIIFFLILVALLFFVGNKLKQEKLVVDIEKINQQMFDLNNKGMYQETVVLANQYIHDFPDNLDLWIHQTMAYFKLSDCINAQVNMYHVSVRVSENDPYYKFVNGMLGKIKKECSNTSKE